MRGRGHYKLVTFFPSHKDQCATMGGYRLRLPPPMDTTRLDAGSRRRREKAWPRPKHEHMPGAREPLSAPPRSCPRPSGQTGENTQNGGPWRDGARRQPRRKGKTRHTGGHPSGRQKRKTQNLAERARFRRRRTCIGHQAMCQNNGKLDRDVEDLTDRRLGA